MFIDIILSGSEKSSSYRLGRHVSQQGLSQDFHNRVSKFRDFKNLGCPKSLIEKVKIIMYTDYVH